MTYDTGPEACTQHLLLRWSSQPLGVPTQQQQADSEGARDAPSEAPTTACQGESVAFEGSVGDLKTALRAQDVPPGLSPATHCNTPSCHTLQHTATHPPGLSPARLPLPSSSPLCCAILVSLLPRLPFASLYDLLPSLAPSRSCSLVPSLHHALAWLAGRMGRARRVAQCGLDPLGSALWP